VLATSIIRARPKKDSKWNIHAASRVWTHTLVFEWYKIALPRRSYIETACCTTNNFYYASVIWEASVRRTRNASLQASCLPLLHKLRCILRIPICIHNLLSDIVRDLKVCLHSLLYVSYSFILSWIILYLLWMKCMEVSEYLMFHIFRAYF
jgi:hypothetical protein